MVVLVMLAVVTVTAKAGLEYSSDARIQQLQNTNYHREDYQWYLRNTGQPSKLYYRGAYQAQDPGGSYDLGFEELQMDMSAVRLGVVESTGVDLTHPDLAGLSISGIAVGSDWPTTDWKIDPSGHGTAIAGVLFARGALQGILPTNCSPVWVRRATGDSAQYLQAIRFLIQQGNVKVVSVSSGLTSPDTNLWQMCEEARQNGIVLVFAAPNVNQNVDSTPDYPASWKFPNVVVVTSVTREGAKYSPAAWGKTTVHIGAPGRVIVTAGSSTVRSPRYVYDNGTSLATPMVAAAILLVANQYPGQPYEFWIDRVLSRAVPEPTLTNTVSGGKLSLQVLGENQEPCLRLQGRWLSVLGGEGKAVYVVQSCGGDWAWQDWVECRSGDTLEIPMNQPFRFYRVRLR